jgi:TRAP-type C4-dicarboxylate transport system substrate-binding protein
MLIPFFLYTALQTKIVDGQENPLTIIHSGKYCEVQKYCFQMRPARSVQRNRMGLKPIRA